MIVIIEQHYFLAFLLFLLALVVVDNVASNALNLFGQLINRWIRPTNISACGCPPHSAKEARRDERDDQTRPVEEDTNGNTRPRRRCYVHTACGASTSLPRATAQVFAGDPIFYPLTTRCGRCNALFPLAEFVWDGTTEPVGS